MYRTMVKSMTYRRQSPIDIKSDMSLLDHGKCQPSTLRIDYKPGDCYRIVVDDHGFQVQVKEDCSSTLSACHLPGVFRLAQFHAHWGQDSTAGSEHAIDGRCYAAEFHFVYWNTAYSTMSEAIKHGDGIAVLGVFVEEGDHNSDYDPLLSAILEAHKIGPPVQMPNNFELTSLLPHGDYDYFTYMGSLTTPPYSEAVIWTVLMNPVHLSKEQLDILRLLTINNYREFQELHGRSVYSSK